MWPAGYSQPIFVGLVLLKPPFPLLSSEKEGVVSGGEANCMDWDNADILFFRDNKSDRGSAMHEKD